MKCIVTAGPTYEELDEVRRMTNFSTGALGTELANFLVEQGHNVTLLRGYYATCEAAAKVERVRVFTTTENLMRQLKELGSDKVGAVFHAAAVSDFGFGKIWRRGADGKIAEIKSGKIPTKEGPILAELKPTPKIIIHLRRWFPRARLVGWKYEVDGDRKKAVALATQQMKDNHTDACVVNGPAYGKGFGLIPRGAACQDVREKADLFDALAHFLEWLD
jgi:phosphopantothenoylcysteine decarboxylase/phosphopantothenate--cysteine ligase